MSFTYKKIRQNGYSLWAQEQLPKTINRQSKFLTVAPSRLQSGPFITQLAHLVCGVSADSRLCQPLPGNYLFILPIPQAAQVLTQILSGKLLGSNEDTQRQERHFPTSWSMD